MMQPKFFDREYLNIVYRTDADALRAVVPAPLEIDEPLVRFEVMKMNDVTGYGPYTEAGQAIQVVFDGEHGEYLHAMYLDSFAATASGREVSAYPKVMGSPRLYADNGALVGTLDYGTIRVATATMGYKHHELDRARGRGSDHGSDVHAQDHPGLRRFVAGAGTRAHGDHRRRGQVRLHRARAVAAVPARSRAARRPSRAGGRVRQPHHHRPDARSRQAGAQLLGGVSDQPSQSLVQVLSACRGPACSPTTA